MDRREFLLDRQDFLRRYGTISRHRVDIGGQNVVFSTHDEYSKRWFYPRYDQGRIHEEPATLLFLDEIAGSRCFADVGANLGWFTCLAAKHLTDGTVFSFELDEQNYHLLEINVLLNRVSNVELVHAAVSDQPGRITYRKPGFVSSATFSILPREAIADDTTVVHVDAVTLDDYFAARGDVPDFVKIDVEGAELQVLRGMLDLIRSTRPRLLVEVHQRALSAYGHVPGDVLSLLWEEGYDVFEVQGFRSHGSTPVLKTLDSAVDISENTMIYARSLNQRETLNRKSVTM
jgi:FkbM family methyltransferase